MREASEETVARTIKMLSDMNTTMMEVERVDRAEDRLVVTGVMMGNFPAEVYLEPDDLLAMVTMHMRPSPLTFVLGLPYFWLRRYLQRPENQGIGARIRGVALSLGLAVGEIVAVIALVVGFVDLARLALALLV